MTLPIMMNVNCLVCGAENTIMGIASTNTMGSPDLDFRPPEMKRSTIHSWVQRCDKCGYCASSVEEENPKAQEMVTSSEYQEQLNDPSYPELANSFLAKALLDHASKDFVSATPALLHAAWVCDDSNHSEQALTSRKKAADMLAFAEEHGQKLFDIEGASTTLLVDLLRRSGQTEKAQQLIKTRRDSLTEKIIIQILDFQAVLLERNDISCHTIAEATKE